MEPKNLKLLAAVVVVGILIIVIVVIWHSFGSSRTSFIVTGVDLALIVAIFTWVTIQYTKQLRQISMARRSVLEGEELRLQYSYLRKVAGLPIKFHYESLQSATDNFRLLIGRGSSASVFKGILEDGTIVAVKRIEGSDHGDAEFRSEVSAIASVQHVNLVRLLGYCLIPARFLVYEFASNGSLDKWIFSESSSHCLPWPVRHGVAVDVARALAYLHDDCRARVLHLDLKPENILLDDSLRALISDFGLSRLMSKDESRIITTLRGTRGYLAPEWFFGRGVSEKCDIFSYGMVLLELVTGKRSLRVVGDGTTRQRQWLYLPRIVMEKVSQGRLMEVVDERLVAEVEEVEIARVVNVAMWCILEEAGVRPSMAEVVDMLQGRVSVEAPPLESDMFVLDPLTMERMTLENDGDGAGRELQTSVSSMSEYTVTPILSGR